jgi:hypothetical protein
MSSRLVSNLAGPALVGSPRGSPAKTKVSFCASPKHPPKSSSVRHAQLTDLSRACKQELDFHNTKRSIAEHEQLGQ